MSKYKRLMSFFLATFLLLGLGACKPTSGPDPSAPPDETPTAKELMELVLPYSGCEHPEAVERLNAAVDGLDTYLEKAYALTGWADGAIIRATGASAFELAAIRLENEDAARAGEALLKDYLRQREGDFTGYAPEQADMVSCGVVCRDEAWLGLFVCPDPEGARTAFETALKGDALPEPPTPAPTAEPEPEVDLLPLMVDLIRFCKEEIDALGGYGAVTLDGVSANSSADYFKKIVEEDYGMDAAQVDVGFRLEGHKIRRTDNAFQLTVIRMIGENEAAQSMDGLRRFLRSYETVFTELGMPEEAELVVNGLVSQSGCYLTLFICQNPEAVRAEFEDALLRLQAAVPSQSPPKVDMELLRDRLEAVCKEELEAKWQKISRTCEVNKMAYCYPGTYFGQAESGLYFGEDEGGHTFQTAVLYMEDERAAVTLAADFQTYLWDKEYQYLEQNFPEQAEQMSNGLIVQTGRYVALFVCQDPQAMKDELEAALRDLAPEGEPSTGPSTLPGTPEQPIFVELDNPMPDGEPDPDHPSRIKYVQPKEEDMSVYDTAAILSAWEKGDPAGLSKDDRAIYDAAQAVLAEVLHDGMSDFETEASLYDWVIQNIDYGWSRVDALDQAPREAYTPYGGLVDRKAVCLGYASSFQLLMELAGLECITVVGASHASTVDHAWNMVRLNRAWYCADATWDYAYREAGQMNGCEWRYFNVTSDFMARTNHQWDYADVPEAVAGDHGKT